MSADTAPRDRPILFSAPMVRAILDGRKTVTRRIVRGQHRVGATATRFEVPGSRLEWAANDAAVSESWRQMLASPYGMPGDRLWVKETYALGKVWDRTRAAEVPTIDGDRLPVWFAADGEAEESWANRGKWRPSIFMRRAFSRITLEVTDVRVERLHDLTEEDAIAEGIAPTEAGTFLIEDAEFAEARTAFSFLWDGIHGERADWESNPWIWRVGFRRAP